MPFDSDKQQNWYHATDQTYLDDEPSSSKQVEEGGMGSGPQDDVDFYEGGTTSTGTTGSKGEPYHMDQSDVKATGHDKYLDMAMADYTDPTSELTNQDYEDVFNQSNMREAEQEEEWSMGEPEQELEQKNIFGKIGSGGFTSKYDMFDPDEKRDEMSYKSDPPEDIYKDYDYEEATETSKADVRAFLEDQGHADIGQISSSVGDYDNEVIEKYLDELVDEGKATKNAYGGYFWVGEEATEAFYGKIIKALED